MQHEILGPILPVCPYASLEEVIAQINAGPCPPLIFPLSRDRTIVEMLADRVLSDEVSIENARFVGEGHRPSAETELRMSRYRGRAGLERFSKMRRIAGRAPFEGLRMPRWLIERLSK
jgi:coniferyl-aldehyde dehydrogenase